MDVPLRLWDVKNNRASEKKCRSAENQPWSVAVSYWVIGWI